MDGFTACPAMVGGQERFRKPADPARSATGSIRTIQRQEHSAESNQDVTQWLFVSRS
ncbi:hypothetical protein FHY11_000987 [Xanthomonas arboricola]|nr:hypothetical protein [Xanthomonas euroxanthea]